MSGRRRTLFLALLALASPLPAFAISEEASKPVSADPGPAALVVSTALDSCGLLDNGVVCKLDVSYNEVDGAASYSAMVTRADGSVVDYGGVPAGGTSLWVPYVGSGNYSVRVTAYGEPDEPSDDHGDVVAVGDSRPEGDGQPRVTKDKAEEAERDAEIEVSPRGAGDTGARSSDGPVETEVGAAPAADPACQAVSDLLPLPEEPPQDLDPNDLDEDDDTIDDQQERDEYAAAVAQRDATLQAARDAGCPNVPTE